MNQPEHRLDRLLAGLDPVLDPVEYAFVQVPSDHDVPDEVEPLATFREDEGQTLIVTAAEVAERGWENRFPCRRITLQVHSALEAVGMLAAVARWLADAGIPANTVSAVNHDHLFVPTDRAEEALAVLRKGNRD